MKKKRLQEIVALQGKLSLESNKKDIGKIFKVLIEGDSKKNEKEWKGRNSHNKVIVFPRKSAQKGEYANVLVTDCTSATLIGELV